MAVIVNLDNVELPSRYLVSNVFGSIQGETLTREQLVDLLRGGLNHLVFIIRHC